VADAKKKKINLDYLGFGLVALAFGSLEVFLDKGQEDDWFGSSLITAFGVMFVVGLLGLIAWELWRIHTKQQPILDLRLFKNRNLAVSFVLMFMVGIVLYAALTMLPQLLHCLRKMPPAIMSRSSNDCRCGSGSVPIRTD
jgi:DHA2 family multidrug resistance protein